MKTGRKLWLCIIAVLTLVLCFAFGASALDATGQCGDNVYWSYDETTGELVISGEGTMWDYERYYQSPFSYSDVKCILIENGVTSIGDYAFWHCGEATSVTIADSVSSIGIWAFNECRKLSTITIPDDVTSIGDGAFSSCYALTAIEVDDNNQFYSSDEYGVLFDKEKTTLIRYPVGNIRTEYMIPSGVTVIFSCAFQDSVNLTDIIIPDGVTEIGGSTFYNCDGITELILPDSVTIIGGTAFRDCDSLKTINFPASITAVGMEAYSSSLESVYAEDIVSWFDVNFQFMFGNPLLYCEKFYLNGELVKDLVIPDEVTSIDAYSLYGSGGMSSVTIHENVNHIGTAILSFYGFEKIIVDENNEYYSSDEYGVLFNKDKTELIRFPSGSSIEKYTVPNTVKTIRDYAFNTCYNLKDVIIPGNVESVGSYSFGDCIELTNIVLSEGLTSIDDHAFSGCKKITDIKIPGSVSRIGEWAFTNCNSLRNIELSDGVTQIGSGAFSVDELEKVIIPESVTTIENTAFSVLGKISDVYYTGSEEQWNKITIEENNDPLFQANFHFNYSGHEHTYTASVLNAPTCMEKGIRKYSCTCGWYYTEPMEIVKHSMGKWEIRYSATCTDSGLEERYCTFDCGYVEERSVSAKGHSMGEWTVTTQPTCTASGEKHRTCTVCGTYEDKTISATGHSDRDGNGVCDNCGEGIDSSSCSCNCHKSGFMGFVWKIMRFFQKLFKVNQICSCGVAHY